MGKIRMIAVRRSNPFATKYVGAGRLAFVGLEDRALDRLVETLIQQNGNGQIVGPHGVGKTTLTFEIEKRIARLFGSKSAVRFIRKTIGPRGIVRSSKSDNPMTLRENLTNHGLSKGNFSSALRPIRTILVLDGFERLSWFQRLALIESCRSKRIGLLITSHRRVWGVRTLVELAPNLACFQTVFKMLVADHELQLPVERLSNIFSTNGYNMREALMSCYDEYEASRASTAC